MSSTPALAAQTSILLTWVCRFASISIIWYLVRGRKTFTGPPVPKDSNPELKGQAVRSDDGETAFEAKEERADDAKLQ